MNDFWFEVVEILQTVSDGILFGTTYALIGIGFTLIFGAMQKLNMSYAAASLAGAYVGLGVYTFFGVPILLVFIASAVGSGIIGLVVYIACFRYSPYFSQPPLALCGRVPGALVLEAARQVVPI